MNREFERCDKLDVGEYCVINTIYHDDITEFAKLFSWNKSCFSFEPVDYILIDTPRGCTAFKVIRLRDNLKSLDNGDLNV